MADHSVYHAMGQPGAPGDDQSRQQGMPPQQPYSSYGAQTPGYQQPGAAPYGAASPPAGYNAGPQYTAPGDGSAIGGLTAQMGGLGISSETAGAARGHKKKHRHAHHDIGGAAGAPTADQGIATESQFLNTGLNQQGLSRPVSPAVPTPSPQPPVQAPPGQPGFHPSASGQVQTQGKVDPEQIPSIPRSRDLNAQYYLKHDYPTMERHLPPPASIPFVARDQGNSSPKFARLTLNNIPATSDMLHSTGLPLGLIIQPLAKLDPGEQSIPVLDFGDAGPPRCRRCRTYINPFMVFRSGGNKFVCNMCSFPNEVPPEYYAPLDPSGARVDRLQRPELLLGTVEFTVPKDYWSKEPVGLRQLFLLDVSQESVKRGLLQAMCNGIIDALYGDEEVDETTGEPARKVPEGSKIGIVTFDKEVHFYNLSVGWQMSRLIVWHTDEHSHNSKKPR